jgi:hypothetical protein
MTASHVHVTAVGPEGVEDVDETRIREKRYAG